MSAKSRSVAVGRVGEVGYVGEVGCVGRARCVGKVARVGNTDCVESVPSALTKDPVFRGARFLPLPLTSAILAAALVALLPIGIAAQASDAPAGNAQNGKQSFTARNCSTCHGADAQGQPSGGPRIGPPDRAFPDFVQYVRMPTGNMPPVSAQRVPDAELADIYAYLQSMKTTAATQAPFSAGPGNADNGKKIFASYGCFECHGYVGQGSKQTGTPRIGPPAISIEAFANYVRKPTGDMPPYTNKVVSDQDMADIFAYLQSIKAPPPLKDIPLLNQ